MDVHREDTNICRNKRAREIFISVTLLEVYREPSTWLGHRVTVRVGGNLSTC